MTKYFCDVCGKELTKHTGHVRVDHWDELDVRQYCRNCFQSKKNWTKIHKP